ncbi:MAG: nitrous oxide-stimulated promoter family protein [Firmicutes bacterium]|nr:nitrous oxide-stimulated promoter family protein [Bacillota bacterium]
MAFSRRLEMKTMLRMLQIYCRDHHQYSPSELCSDCLQIVDYAEQRMDKCPYGENKPVCSKCPVHCYRPEQREVIRQIMRYSGPRMLWNSPVLTIRYMYRKTIKSIP